MAAKFSIDSLVGGSKDMDSSVETSVLRSAFVRPSELSSEESSKGLSQSWGDVLLPHFQMASTNPFLVGLNSFPSTSGGPLRPGAGYSEILQAAFQGRSTGFWPQQWLEMLQQADHHQRLFQGIISTVVRICYLLSLILADTPGATLMLRV